MQRLQTTTAAIIVLAVAASVGCATKGFVTETVEDRVDVIARRVTDVETELSGTNAELAETSATTERLDTRLGEVDRTASSALETARGADESAQVARDDASNALVKTDRLEAAARQLAHELVISEDHGQFAFDDATVPESAMAGLEDLVTRYREHPGGIHLEIEGHTDATGPTELNERLGLARAEAIKRYLYETHQVPLHKMNVISFGEEKPVAPNDTREGRARNRRVVVRVLGVASGTVATASSAGATPASRAAR